MAEQRDWDRELADIDKIIAGGGAPASAGKPAARAASAPAAQAAPARAPSGRGAVLGTWFRVVLAVSLASALAVWPFAHWCGGGLALYLAAVGLGVITSLWAAAASWTHRRGFAHVLGLGTLLATLVLGAAELLPRLGYAKELRTWSCAVLPVQSVTTPATSSAAPAAPQVAPISGGAAAAPAGATPAGAPSPATP